MKKLLLLVVTLTTFNAKSQTSVYHPFPEDSATWITDNYSDMCLGYCSSNFYQMKGDTLINSQSYNKIYNRHGSLFTSLSVCGYTGAIRQDSINKKVYFIDSTMTIETLLYDFNLAIGDTIQNWYNLSWAPFPLIISGIDSAFINGSYRKRFNFQNFISDLYMSLIEGVGWTGDLFLGLLYSPDGTIILTCFNGQTLADIQIPNECTVLLDCNLSVGVDKENEKKCFSLFPNPFSDKLYVTISGQESSEITLYDITSRNLFQQKFTNSASLNSEKLAKGIYIYEVRNKNGIIAKGKIIRQ